MMPVDKEESAVDDIPAGIAAFTRTGEILRANSKLCEILGYGAGGLAGKHIRDIISSDSFVPIDNLAQRAISANETEFSFDATLLKINGARLLAGVDCRLRDGGQGASSEITAVIRDVTEQKALLEHQKFLLQELSHRTKNLLAVIQGLARQMTAYATSAEDFEKRFTPRLTGLAISHNVLVEANWEGADLAEIIARQLRPFALTGGARLKIEGPPLIVKPVAVQHLGMTLYELGANAKKHGALSTKSGVVTISWTIEGAGEEPAFHLVWTERDGPPAREPETSGFGQSVTEQMLPYALNGDVDVAFAPEGYRWAFTAPLARVCDIANAF